MKTTNILYWVFTGLMALLMLFSSVASLMDIHKSEEFFKHLQQPGYMITFLSVAKILGVIVILIPGFPRLKEWAYAGLTFDLAGAIYSFISVGDPISQWGLLILGLIFIAGSYYFYHRKAEATSLSVA